MPACPAPPPAAAPVLPAMSPARDALRRWADDSYGPRGWESVSLVVQRPGPGSADVIQVERGD